MMQRAAGAVISNGEWVISFFSQVQQVQLVAQLFGTKNWEDGVAGRVRAIYNLLLSCSQHAAAASLARGEQPLAGLTCEAAAQSLALAALRSA